MPLYPLICMHLTVAFEKSKINSSRRLRCENDDGGCRAHHFAAVTWKLDAYTDDGYRLTANGLANAHAVSSNDPQCCPRRPVQCTPPSLVLLRRAPTNILSTAIFHARPDTGHFARSSRCSCFLRNRPRHCLRSSSGTRFSSRPSLVRDLDRRPSLFSYGIHTATQSCLHVFPPPPGYLPLYQQNPSPLTTWTRRRPPLPSDRQPRTCQSARRPLAALRSRARQARWGRPCHNTPRHPGCARQRGAKAALASWQSLPRAYPQVEPETTPSELPRARRQRPDYSDSRPTRCESVKSSGWLRGLFPGGGGSRSSVM